MSKFGDYESNPLLAEMYDRVPMYCDRPDREFYLQEGRETDGRILELGCGTGRILIPLAEAGNEITGLDISDSMLEVCRAKLKQRPQDAQDRVRLVQGNMIKFNLNESFSLAIIPFRAFQHVVDVEEQLASLRCINRHLQMNGRLVFDVYQVNMKQLRRERTDEEIENTPEFELPDGRRMRRTHRAISVDYVHQFSQVELIYYLTEVSGEVTRTVQAFPFRYFFRYEIEHLLARCGFKVIELFGDFDRSPLAADSTEMIFIAEKHRTIKD